MDNHFFESCRFNPLINLDAFSFSGYCLSESDKETAFGHLRRMDMIVIKIH